MSPYKKANINIRKYAINSRINIPFIVLTLIFSLIANRTAETTPNIIRNVSNCSELQNNPNENIYNIQLPNFINLQIVI